MAGTDESELDVLHAAPHVAETGRFACCCYARPSDRTELVADDQIGCVVTSRIVVIHELRLEASFPEPDFRSAAVEGVAVLETGHSLAEHGDELVIVLCFAREFLDKLGEAFAVGLDCLSILIRDFLAEPEWIREVDWVPFRKPIQIEPARQADGVFLREPPARGVVVSRFSGNVTRGVVV